MIVCEGCPESKTLIDEYDVSMVIPDPGSDICKQCVRERIAKARAEGTRELLSEPNVILHCPVCGEEHLTYNKVANRSRLLYCPRCEFDFEIIPKQHKVVG